jgi:hypothetical protein
MATIKKRPSGNYQVQIRLSGLKNIIKTFKTKTLATQFVREVEGSTQLLQALGKPIIEKITFKEFADVYMEQYTGKDASNNGRLNWWCNQLGTMQVMKIDELLYPNLSRQLFQKSYFFIKLLFSFLSDLQCWMNTHPLAFDNPMFDGIFYDCKNQCNQPHHFPELQ